MLPAIHPLGPRRGGPYQEPPETMENTDNSRPLDPARTDTRLRGLGGMTGTELPMESSNENHAAAGQSPGARVLQVTQDSAGFDIAHYEEVCQRAEVVSVAARQSLGVRFLPKQVYRRALRKQLGSEADVRAGLAYLDHLRRARRSFLVVDEFHSATFNAPRRAGMSFLPGTRANW